MFVAKYITYVDSVVEEGSRGQTDGRENIFMVKILNSYGALLKIRWGCKPLTLPFLLPILKRIPQSIEIVIKFIVLVITNKLN